MGQLFLEAYSMAGGRAVVPVESAVCLSVVRYLGGGRGMHVTLVVSPASTPRPGLAVCMAGLDFLLAPLTTLQPPVSHCRLPVFTAPASSCVAGLCAVLRQVVKHSGEDFHHLLGFREGCLFACAEVSLWTKFCEIDVVEVVNEVLSGKVTQDINIPSHIAKFEEHLKQPVRMHNVDKLRKETNQESLNHDFAEGCSMSLADLIIIPCFRVFVQALDNGSLEQTLPSVMGWYRLVLRQDGIAGALSIIYEVPSLVRDLTNVNYSVPAVPRYSLYKSDPKRYKPRLKQFTRQEDVEVALSIVEEVGLEVALECEVGTEPLGHELTLDWQAVPSGVQPDVPPRRLNRKRQQLDNLAKTIIKVAKAGDRIVDFCCGSGHLGIVVAHLLPACHVVLLDNKEQSLARARARVIQLGLANVTTVQCNLDYWTGPFQIGVSLHACGVATDLVIHTCLQQNAAFVVCPCCYGSLQSNHVVGYPRSALMAGAGLSLRQYLVLGHCADQTGRGQGERCMALVDGDRCRLARERGYSVSLAKLRPPTCSPKNNLLIGIPPS